MYNPMLDTKGNIIEHITIFDRKYDKACLQNKG